MANNSDMFEKDDKIMTIIGSVGLSATTTSILAQLFNMDTLPQYLTFLTGGTIITGPLIYFGMKKIKSILDEKEHRHMHQLGQLCVMLQETKETDRRIGKMTTLFLPEILDVFENQNKDFPKEKLMNINQFVYLINCNYYEKINGYLDINREQLAKRIINQISIYLNNTARDNFNELDAELVLKKCFFIPETLKDEIAKEFKKSKVKVFGEEMFEIIRTDISSDIDEYLETKKEETKGRPTNFNIEDKTHYEFIINNIAKSEGFKKLELGEATNLNWDIDFLMKIMKKIALNHRDELIETNEYFSNYRLALSFIYNATIYATVNNKAEVGKNELLNSFKNWNYIPFEIKLDVLDEIFTEEQIPYDFHPYKISKPQNKQTYKKIIPFIKNNNKLD